MNKILKICFSIFLSLAILSSGMPRTEALVKAQFPSSTSLQRPPAFGIHPNISGNVNYTVGQTKTAENSQTVAPVIEKSPAAPPADQNTAQTDNGQTGLGIFRILTYAILSIILVALAIFAVKNKLREIEK